MSGNAGGLNESTQDQTETQAQGYEPLRAVREH